MREIASFAREKRFSGELESLVLFGTGAPDVLRPAEIVRDRFKTLGESTASPFPPGSDVSKEACLTNVLAAHMAISGVAAAADHQLYSHTETCTQLSPATKIGKYTQYLHSHALFADSALSQLNEGKRNIALAWHLHFFLSPLFVHIEFPITTEHALQNDMASKQLTPLTDEEIKTLIDKSRSAKGFAHAPYSNFPVGAALLAKDGRIFTGESVVFFIVHTKLVYDARLIAPLI